MRKSPSTVGVLVALAIVSFAACGKSSSSADPAKDKVKAMAIVAQQADFPAGWTSTQAAAGNGQQNAELMTCVGRDTAASTSAYVDGPDFAQGQALQVRSNVVFTRSATDAKSDIAAIKGDKLTACLTTTFSKALSALVPGAEVSNLKVAPGTAPAFGDASAAYRLTTDLKIPALGVNLPLSIDYVAIQKGRAVVRVTFIGNGAPFDASLEKALIAKVGARVAKA